MSISIFQAGRKRKRKPALFELHKLADQACNSISPVGPFRSNIRGFLRDLAMAEDENLDGNSTLRALLCTIEETVQNSEEPFCDDLCRCCGKIYLLLFLVWNSGFFDQDSSNHSVAKCKSHMIIPTDMQCNKPLEDDVFDIIPTDGLIHCNGFGHLLHINGIEGSSKCLNGREVMDLWDRICLNLRARKITVEDLSQKRSMDLLRLVNGVSYGKSWFGRWAYKFCHASYGVSEHNAIEVCSSIEAANIVEESENTIQCKENKKVIHHCRDMSETQLTAIDDLTAESCVSTQRVVTAMKPSKNSVRHKKSRDQTSLKYEKFSTVIDNLSGRWPARRLQTAAEVIVEALKEKRSMTRQDLRNAARMHIGDTGLLDYVLKSINNVVVGNYIVRRAVNPTTRILEFSVQDLLNEGSVSEPEYSLSEGCHADEKILKDFDDTIQSKETKKVIHHYRDVTETQLTAINDLLKYMRTFKSRVPTQRSVTAAKPSKNSVQKSRDNTSLKYKKFSRVIANLGGRWPARRLQTAAEVIVRALKEKRSMTRQDVRDAARMHIGDTGLLDHVLKSMNDVVVGNYIVRRAVNPTTRTLEYTVHDLENEGLASEPKLSLSEGPLEDDNRARDDDIKSTSVFIRSKLHHEMKIQLNKTPEWLEEFLREFFFDQCSVHPVRGNEKNLYCISCKLSACQHCISSSHDDHSLHKILKVYRHVHKNVVSLSAMDNHINCDEIQPFKSNKRRVISLSPLPHGGSSSSSSNAGKVSSCCKTCERRIAEPDLYNYCSISCKVMAFEMKPTELAPPFLYLIKDQQEKARTKRKGTPSRAPLY